MISIKIAERYTEEIIFDKFAEVFAGPYRRWLTEREFESAVQSFIEAIRKPNGYSYVINMAKTSEHELAKYEQLRGTNVIAVFQEIEDLYQLKSALYQVRCNIFHGEKVPGEINDDRITQAAVPVLRRLVHGVFPPASSVD